MSESTLMANPLTVTSARRVFLSAPLKQDLRISGTPVVHLRAALSAAQSNLGAALVDYGATTRVTRSGEGIQNVTPADTDCWGSEVAGDFSACYKKVFQPMQTAQLWRVTRGILDSSNRASLSTPTPVTVGAPTDFPITLIGQDHVFPAGHQIGVVLVGTYSGVVGSGIAASGTTVSMDAKASTITLPVVGGAGATERSGGFDRVAPTLTLPADRTATTAPGAATATVSWPAPAASDDQDPSPAVACTPASGSAFPVGATTVTCTATDASANAASGTFTVTVTGTPAPPSTDGGGSSDGTTVGGGTANGGNGPAAQAAGGGAAGATPATAPVLDVVPVALTQLRLSAGVGQLLARFRLSGRATVTISVTRKGARRATATLRRTLKAGKGAMRLRAKGLKPGRYVVTITVRVPGRPASRPLTRTVTVRPAG